MLRTKKKKRSCLLLKYGFPGRKKAIFQKWKPLGIVTSVVSRSFHLGETPMWFPLGFHTWKQSTRRFHLDCMPWKLGGNLTSGFHEFPHLETVNPRIPPRFLALETSGNFTGGFHEFPHLETVNPTIPPCLIVLYTSGNLAGGFHEFPHM